MKSPQEKENDDARDQAAREPRDHEGVPAARGADRPAAIDPLERALEASNAILERQLGVAPGSISALAEEEANAQRALAEPTATPGAIVSDAWAAGITQPIKAPAGPRRPIDDAEWEGSRFRPRVDVRVESAITYEADPCPSWMQPATYAEILADLMRAIMDPARRKEQLTKRHAWAARHVWVTWTPPKIVSASSAADLIGPALEFVRQAKAHGFTNAELAHGGRRRLLR